MKFSVSSIAATAAAVAFLAAQATALEQQSGAGAVGQHYIFFDFGRPVLTRDGEAVLEQVAKVAAEKPQLSIRVAGYSDAAGPARANAAVSRRRAEVVRAELERLGVAGEKIRLSFHGESNLLIPTADGVREAQNRRVEIRIVEPGPE